MKAETQISDLQYMLKLWKEGNSEVVSKLEAIYGDLKTKLSYLESQREWKEMDKEIPKMKEFILSGYGSDNSNLERLVDLIGTMLSLSGGEGI